MCFAEQGGREATSRPETPHTCTAYQLLRGYSETVDVGDWFASFCLALGAKASATKKAKSKGRTAQKKKKKMKTVERTCDAAGPSQPVKDEVEEDDGEVCFVFLGLFLEPFHCIGMPAAYSSLDHVRANLTRNMPWIATQGVIIIRFQD